MIKTSLLSFDPAIDICVLGTIKLFSEKRSSETAVAHKIFCVVILNGGVVKSLYLKMEPY